MFFFTHSHANALTHLLYPSRCCRCSKNDTKNTRKLIVEKHTHKYTSSHTPFLEEMSLASSSLRLARESASSSARGRAFSWGAERLCWRWGSPKVWMSASRWATQTNKDTRKSRCRDMRTYCDFNQSACCSSVVCLCLSERLVPWEGAETERWPSSRSWEEKGSPKQLAHRTASTTHTHNPAVI